MKCLQLSVNHCQIAQNLLAQTVYELMVDVAILGEPYKKKDYSCWVSNRTNAICCCNTIASLIRISTDSNRLRTFEN